MTIIGWDQLELPFARVGADRTCGRSRFAVFDACPMCGGDLAPEHAHFRCGSCAWRDSCCD